MRIDRRRFMQLGALAALGDVAGCCHTSPVIRPTIPNGSGSPPPPAPPTTVAVDFEGLYLFEEIESSAMMHLLDARALGMSSHRAQLQVKRSLLNDRATTKPDPEHVLMDGTPNETWTWDLAGRWVTTPASDNGDDDLLLPGTTADDSAEIPSTDAGWNSRVRVADLRVCCGATRITKEKGIASSITLTHGRIDVLNPGGLGARTVWQFTGPHDEVLIRRALSNRMRYSCPTGGQELALYVDDVPIVFKAAGGLASIMNMPMSIQPCVRCLPRMSHFKGFFDLVDKKITPDICLVSFTPAVNEDAGTDYCPGGSI